ncbi:MAG: hypothetical protein H0U54_01055 [Acidobacteria bacterium]|nr:hypothetical protein [Acidobacteriota bacterium]
MDTKDPKSTESADAHKIVESKDPKSDATSSQTLSEVEESEKVSKTNESEAPEGEGSSVPSPDGAFDEGRGGTGELEGSGPM